MPTDVGPDTEAPYPPGQDSPVVAAYSPLAVSNTFIARFGDAAGIQHMKLQKLAYYTHAWWLSHYNQPFLNSRPQVWKFGPVFADLYQDLKGFGWRPIKEPQRDDPFGEPEIITDANINLLINWIWGRYGAMTAEDLSTRTHAPGTPWYIIAEQHGYVVPRNATIDDEIIKRCFRGDVQEVLAAQ